MKQREKKKKFRMREKELRGGRIKEKDRQKEEWIKNGEISLESLSVLFLAKLCRKEKKERERILERAMDILRTDTEGCFEKKEETL